MGPHLLLALLAAGSSPEEVKAPHVLFVLIDTCRADRMGLYREDRETTPFLSELAESSVVFERCRSQAPWTKPSMASILTSRYPSEVGIHDMFQRLDDRWTLLPEVLSAAGYHTAGFSTNPLMGGMSNYTQGFDEFVESTQINGGDPVHFASGSAAKVNERALPWLHSASTEQATFLYVHLVDPHEEYEPAPEYLEQFADPGRHEQYRSEWAKLLMTRPPLPGLHVTPWNFEKAGVDQAFFIEHGLNLYDADILACDAQIERLVNAARERWGQNMIVVVASDHGEEFMEHDGTSHAFCLYDELIRVPLLIHAPGFEGRRVPDNVRNLDIYPTLCELCGIEPPRGLRGRSLVPLMRGHDLDPLPVLSELVEDSGSRNFGEPMGIMHSVVDGRWKLIRTLRDPVRLQRPDLELFDLEADPGETTNRADDEPELAARLARLVDGWTAANLGLEARAVSASDLDPEALAQLEQLGYFTGDGEEDIADVHKLPLLIRAVLEGASRWTVLGLDPAAGRSPDAPDRKQSAGWVMVDRGQARDQSRQDLQETLYKGLAAGVEPPERAPFLPRYGLLVRHRGHTVVVLCDFESRRVRVLFNGKPQADLAVATGAGRVVAEVFERLQVEVGTR